MSNRTKFSQWVEATVWRVRIVERRLVVRGYMGRSLFQDRMIPWARRWGSLCARKNKRRLVMFLWAASSSWGVLCMLAMMVLGAPLLLPLWVASERMWTWGTAQVEARPARARLCRLVGSCLGVAAEALASVEYAWVIWCTGMGAATLAAEACAQAVSERPQWAPQGRWAAMAGLNAFVLMGTSWGTRAVPGAMAAPGLLARVEAFGFSHLENISILASASMPVGVLGTLWGPCAPCPPWRTPLDGVERKLAQSGGATPAEAHWIEWAKSLREKRTMEAYAENPKPRMERGRVKRL